MITEPRPVAPGSGAKGCYLLRLNLPVQRDIAVGRRGETQFAAGAYLYVGSAFGPGGVRARLAHHLRRSTRPHWHIDYLRHHAAIDEIWFAETGLRLEHDWASVVANMPGCVPVNPGLGASDCGCSTHLFYFRSPPELSLFVDSLLPSLDGDFNRQGEHQAGYTMQRWQS